MRFFNLLWNRQPEQQREMLCDRGKIGIMDRINPSRSAADSAPHHVRNCCHRMYRGAPRASGSNGSPPSVRAATSSSVAGRGIVIASWSIISHLSPPRIVRSRQTGTLLSKSSDGVPQPSLVMMHEFHCGAEIRSPGFPTAAMERCKRPSNSLLSWRIPCAAPCLPLFRRTIADGFACGLRCRAGRRDKTAFPGGSCTKTSRSISSTANRLPERCR